MIRTEADIEDALQALLRIDPRFGPILDFAGQVPLRKSPDGLRGLTGTIVSQQVSRASADAIFQRFAAIVDLDDPRAILAAPDEVFRQAGLSRPKQRTMRAIAEAVLEGRLDFARIGKADAPEAIAEMVAVHGIGRWTAECHLLFAVGHPDVFPAGDLALQVAAAHGLRLPERPKEKPLAAMASLWKPARSVAARLFWSYYHALTRREAAPSNLEIPQGKPIS